MRCAGMLEAIRIRKTGYGVRRSFDDFFSRFQILAPEVVLPKGAKAGKEHCKSLLKTIFRKLQRPEDKSFQLGTTRVFMKDNLEKDIEQLLANWRKQFTVKIQTAWRRYSKRKLYRAMRSSALFVQAMGRRWEEM